MPLRDEVHKKKEKDGKIGGGTNIMGKTKCWEEGGDPQYLIQLCTGVGNQGMHCRGFLRSMATQEGERGGWTHVSGKRCNG